MTRHRQLDAVCRIATALFGVPFAHVSVLDETCQWFVGREGVNEDSTPRARAFCALAVANPGEPLIILDTLSDPRVADHPAVVGNPQLRFYAGIPLSMEAGRFSATFCIADRRPWPAFTDEHLRLLRDMATFVEAHLSLVALQDRRATEAEMLRVTLDSMDQGIVMTDAAERVQVHNRQVVDLLGIPASLLEDGSPFANLRAFQAERGEYEGLPDGLRTWLEQGKPEHRLSCYERSYPNGKTIEVRTMPVGQGGLVRTYTDISARRAAERASGESERRFRLIAENVNDIIALTDLDLRRIYISPAVTKILGYEPASIVGSSPLNIVHPDDQHDLIRIAEDVRDGRLERALTTQRYLHRDGHSVWLEISMARRVDPDTGRVSGVVSTMRDITARKRAEEAVQESERRLRTSEERLALALDSGGDGLFDVDIEHRSAWHSPSWIERLGYESCDADMSIGFLSELLHPDDKERVLASISKHLDGATSGIEIEHRMVCKDGTIVWVLTRARVTRRSHDGTAQRLVGTMIDISHRKVAELRIAHMAEHDALTDLPNRHLFQQRLGAALRPGIRTSSHHAVLVCDLDRFKVVNDTLGHLTGDMLLCAAGERLRSAVRCHDFVARLGGDEFAVILHDMNARDVPQACERIVAAFATPMELDGNAISVGISVGCALLGPSDTSPADVFKRADIALYQAKAAGRNTHCIYAAEAHARLETRSVLALEMAEALRRGEFFLVYQPIVDVQSGTVSGFEALMRWRHPERGLISPTDFIPIAEETGLIVTLGTWALAEACRVAAEWPHQVSVAVNVSAVQFRGGLEEAVLKAIQTASLDPRRLKLEVTETALMHDPELAVGVLRRLRESGVHVALDDFGTGYSSLTYLRRFPFDRIKIDRSFVRDIADPNAAAIVRAVVGIATRLGMGIVAEGVETIEQLEAMRREGCAEVQGFLFSQAMGVDDIPAFLDRFESWALAA